MVISETSGVFDEFGGTITNFDGDKAKKASVEVTIQTASFNSYNEDRDAHVKNPDFLDVEKFPTATFKSTKIKNTGDKTYDVTGDFTLHGVTKSITIPMTFKGTVNDPWGNTRAGFVGGTTIKRSDYGISYSKTLEAGGLVVGDEVRLDLRIEAVQKKDEAK